ncbi:unnamed protein product [Bursaphelenchus okinawaensis]|uniref:Uncharacterized protein n=1 Tax=Bursaphelenchus okinawaensis TaxID=465554 RepID=A0A811KUC8_9BILA|nr:unnamed protein product [Bursaphelenchus okinawaensis]CAG9112134.1 unnamed protein product [Bursaphelenchus okinawaensis]
MCLLRGYCVVLGLLFIILCSVNDVYGQFVKKGSSFEADSESRLRSLGILLSGGAKNEDRLKGPGPVDCECKESTVFVGIADGSGIDGEYVNEDYVSKEVVNECQCPKEDNHNSSSVTSTKYGYSDYCYLLKALNNATFEFEDRAIQIQWVQMLERLQSDVIFDASLSDKQKIVAIYGELLVFTANYPSTASSINNIYISEWRGFVANLEEVTVYTLYHVTDVVIELDSNGNCVLLDTLRKINSRVVNNDDIQKLIIDLRLILKGNKALSSKLADVYVIIANFLGSDNDRKAVVLGSYIDGYGYVGVLFSTASYYWRAQNLSPVISGSPCQLISSLNTAAGDTSLATVSQRNQIKKFTKKLANGFRKNLSVESRSKYFNVQLYQWLIIQPWATKVILSLKLGDYGTIGQMVSAISFKANAAPIDVPEPETSSFSPGDCSSTLDLIIKTPNQNTSLSQSVADAMSESWTRTQKARFSAYFRRINRLQNKYSGEDSLNKVCRIFKYWTRARMPRQQVFDIVVYKYGKGEKVAEWGTVREFCQCSGS